MYPVLDSASHAIGASNIQFVAYLMMGAVVGWLMMEPRRLDADCLGLIMVAVCGAWLAAEFHHLFGQAPRGGPYQLLAALIGAFALAFVWQRARRRSGKENGGSDIAIH